MASKVLTTFNDFSQGINDKDAPNLIPNNALVEAQNAVIGRGFVSKRNGFIKYTSSALSFGIKSLYDFFKNNDTKEFLATSNKTLYKDNAGALSAIPFNPTNLTFTTGDVRFLTYKDRSVNDVVLIADSGKLKVYNGTNVSEVTPHSPSTAEQTDPGLNGLASLTRFRTIAIKKDRIFAAAHPTVKNRVSFCHHDPAMGFAAYDYWPAPFYFDVSADENDEIVELKVFRDGLLILCKRSVWILYGDGRTISDYELHRINVPGGCISSKSVQIVGNDLFYLSEDHVYALYATEENYVSARIVSESIESSLKKLSRADKEKAVGYFNDNKYYLAFPNGTCFVYDLLLKSWAKWTNIRANCFLNREGTLYFGSDTGHIYQFKENVYSDDGAAIPFVMKTKIIDFGFAVQDKKFKRLWIVAKQYDNFKSTFDIQALIDHYIQVDLSGINQFIEIDTSAVWDTSDWDESIWDFAEVIQTELKLRERGKNVQLIISNSALDEPLTIYGTVFRYKIKKP